MGSLLAGCSGGSGGGAVVADSATDVSESSEATAVAGYLSGTAAVGAPLGLANVSIKGTAGLCKTGMTNSLGVFSLDVSSCTGPFHINVVSSIGEVSTLASSAGEIINVTPLTQLISQRATGLRDLSSVVLSGLTASTLRADMTTKESEIKVVLKEYAKSIGAVDDLNSVNLMSGSFSANGKGIDKLLDLVKIKNTGGGTLVEVSVGTGTAINFDVNTAAAAPAAISATDATTYASQVSAKVEILDGIRTFATGFTGIFKNGLPTREKFNQYIDAGYLGRGNDADELYGDLDGDDIAGLQFRNIVVLKDSPSDFWVAFQIFGIENGKYVLWGTWTSKVDVVNNKLLGDRMPLGLYPGFVKSKLIRSANEVVTASTTMRVLETSNHSGQEIILKKYNDVAITGGNVVINGLVDPSDSRLIDNLSAEFVVIHPDDALKPISKVTYSVAGAADAEAYIYVPQAGEENPGHYVDLTYPAFRTATGLSDNCRYNKTDLASVNLEEDFSLSNTDFDLGGFEMYFVDYSPSSGQTSASSYPGFAAYSWDQLTNTLFQARLTDYVTQATSKNYLEIGKFDVANTVSNDIEYHTIYTCE